MVEHLKEPDFLAKAFEIFEDFTLNVLDVGAANHSPSLSADLQKRIKFFAIEPDKSSWPDFGSRHFEVDRWFDVAVGDKVGEFEFYLTRKAELSSFRKPNREILNDYPNPERFDICRTVRQECETVDNLILKFDVNRIDYMKLDAQGTALEVLKGAKDCLKEMQAITLEAEVVPLYKDQFLIQDILEYLHKKKFELIEMRPIYWLMSHKYFLGQENGRIIFYNTLFVNRKILKNLNRESIIAKIILLIHFKFYDLAYEILCRPEIKHDFHFLKLRRHFEAYRDRDVKSAYKGSIAEWPFI